MPAEGRPRSLDLWATIALTLAALVVALLLESGPVSTIFLAPLVLILPGYALSAALFAPQTIGPARRLVLTIVLSLSATALGGLLLQLIFALNRGVFAALAASVTLSAAAFALRARRAMPAARIRAAGSVRIPLALPLSLAAAIAISAVSIAIATHGARRQLESSHFSALWLVPRGGVQAARPALQTGISNQEGGTVRYGLTVSQGTRRLRSWRVRLAAGAEWQARVPGAAVHGTRAVVVNLSRFGAPYRRASVELVAAAGGGANG